MAISNFVIAQWRRLSWRNGRKLSQLVARDVRREIYVVDNTQIADGFLVARVRTWNLLYASKGLTGTPEFGQEERIAIDTAWDWDGSSWGGDPTHPMKLSAVRAVDIVTHEQPADANLVLRIDLGVHGDMPERHEQVWAKQLGETSAELRSIPFFAYGMAPDDVLEITPSYEIVSAERGSNHVLRIAAPRTIADSLHERLHEALDTARLVHEWNGVGYVAILLPTAQVPAPLHSLLLELKPTGVQYEISTEARS